jgi:hypothetical protein
MELVPAEVSETPKSSAITELAAAIDLFCQRSREVTPEAIAWELIHLQHQRDRLDLEFSKGAAAFAATEEYDEQGSSSPIHWIRFHCHMGGGAAADRIAVGQLSERLAESVEATQQGEIGFAHLALIARTAAAAAGSPYTKLDEAPLLEKAREFSVGRFRVFCDQARHAADADRYVRGEIDAVESRTLSIKPGENGLVFVRGTLDAEGGAAVRTALEPLARRGGKTDIRKKDRRLADALVELATHTLDTGSIPQLSGQRAHL